MAIHYDLFAGIGGFSVALDNVYGKENTKHIFVEIDPFCQAVLKKHWPEGEFWGDIWEFVANADSQRSGTRENSANKNRKKKNEGWNKLTQHRVNGQNCTLANAKSGEPGKQTEQERRKDISRSGEPNVTNAKCERYKGGKPQEGQTARCDKWQVFLTGGFPCQPFSQAGRRKGTADDRYLWLPMFESIKLIRPDWVIAENVYGLITWNEGMVLEQVCTDLENEGYEVQPFIIPAVSVNAPHRRDRVWIVAYAENAEWGRSTDKKNQRGRTKKIRRPISNACDSVLTGFPNRNARTIQGQSANKKRERPTGGCFTTEQWHENWIEVAQRLCGLGDGLPARLGGLGREDYSLYPWWRKEALKAYGNAIVPQVAEKIFEGIKKHDQT